MGDFVHLHLHTEYSLLDGMSRIKKGKATSPLVEALKQRGMTACAITDHGNMYGVYPFVEALEKGGIKPIIGCEFYVVDDHKINNPEEERNHLILIAKNQTGYQNLMKLSSISFIDGFYYRPRIDLGLIKQYSEGLICLTACIQGSVPKYLLNGDYEGAKRYAEKLKSLFADGDFYIEIQYHGTNSSSETVGYNSIADLSVVEKERLINPELARLANELGVKLVATNDVHYLDKSDAEAQDVLMCINMQRKVGDPDRIKLSPQEYYLKSYEEMAAALPAYPEALAATVEIAEKCNVKVVIEEKKGVYHIPDYVPEDDAGNPLGISPEEYLRDLAYKGLKKKYPVISEEIKERMEHELQVIISMGFAGYYLIVWDFINYSKSHGVPVGPGRGSGVGSLVAYCIGITNVEPLRYNLIFERFLNPERISMPDFDIDFCIEGRGRVIDYVARKYHPENVSQIIAFGTLSARAAVKDVARVFDIPYGDADRWAKAIPMEAGKSSIDRALGKDGTAGASPDFISYYENDATARSVIDMARRLEGMPRQTSMHAAGVLICPKPVVEYLPLQKKDNSITTQFDKDQVEHMGLVKMDFLGLRTLTDIALAIQYIKEDFGIDIDFDKLGTEDPEVYKEISGGDTVAIFQLESAGMCKFMTQLRPDKLEEVIAGVALYRPGPMQFIKDYIRGKQNPNGVQYAYDKLRDSLGVTYGCIVYQEQVMQIARDLAGYSWGGADELRRAMGKKKADVMKANKEYFLHGREATAKSKAIPGAVAMGVPEKIADDLFEQILKFAQYAFNKSHATAYSVVTYQTAFLKHYYPVQFMSAILNNRITDAKEISKYVNYLNSKDIKVLPPDINRSSLKFSTEGKSVRFGLMAVKNVGELACKAIIEERERGGKYTDLEDLLRRNDNSYLNKRMVENLIKGGAFDCFGRTRSTLIGSYEQIMNTVANDRKRSQTGQISLFDMMFDDSPVIEGFKYHDIPEYSEVEKLGYEKEVLGMYATGHPLNSFKRALNMFNFNTAMLYKELDAADEEEIIETEDDENDARLDYSLDGQWVSMGGALSEFTKKISKSSGKNMGYGVLEDLHGSIDVVFFSDAFEKYRNLLFENSFISVQGKLSVSPSDRPKIMVRSVEKLVNPSEMNNEKKKAQLLYLRVVKDNKLMRAVQSTLSQYPGEDQVRLNIEGKTYEIGQTVCICESLLLDLSMVLGDENIKLLKL